MHRNNADRMANSVDPDQTVPLRDPDQEQSDLGLHCLPRPICQKTKDHYGRWGVFDDYSKIIPISEEIDQLQQRIIEK